jgi:hypothetical protein
MQADRRQSQEFWETIERAKDRLTVKSFLALQKTNLRTLLRARGTLYEGSGDGTPPSMQFPRLYHKYGFVLSGLLGNFAPVVIKGSV